MEYDSFRTFFLREMKDINMNKNTVVVNLIAPPFSGFYFC